MRLWVEWFFRDRQTGRLSVVAWPNLSLWTWIGAQLLAQFLDGRWETVVSLVGTGALVVWAGDELLRGVNPWRRCLGLAVLVGTVSSSLR